MRWLPSSSELVNTITSESAESLPTPKAPPRLAESPPAYDTRHRRAIVEISGLGGWSGTGKGGNFSEHWIDGVFDQKLGNPVSDATYDRTSDTWIRTFHSGTVAKFSAKTQKGQITWGK